VPPTSACAAFIKESRMDFANANKVYRKSGGSPTIAFAENSLFEGYFEARTLQKRLCFRNPFYME
jgi:hypothetical protein